MTSELRELLANETDKLRQAGLYRLHGAAAAKAGPLPRVDFTDQDYLDLAAHREPVDAAAARLQEDGIRNPLSPIHDELGRAVAETMNTEAAIIFSSGYMANLGTLTALFDHRDWIFCEAWAQPSLGEGARLSGARTVPFDSADLEYLDDQLRRSKGARLRAICIDGVKSISGEIADLEAIVDMAERYDAIVIVDESLSLGILGPNGAGAVELRELQGHAHILTGSFSKALATVGGFTAASPEVIDWLGQKAVHRLWSSELTPAMSAAALASLDLIESEPERRENLLDNVSYISDRLQRDGFRLLGSGHPAISIELPDVLTLQRITNRLREADVLAHGLCYPIVPENGARLQLHVRSAHATDDLDKVCEDLKQAGEALKVL